MMGYHPGDSLEHQGVVYLSIPRYNVAPHVHVSTPYHSQKRYYVDGGRMVHRGQPSVADQPACASRPASWRPAEVSFAIPKLALGGLPAFGGEPAVLSQRGVNDSLRRIGLDLYEPVTPRKTRGAIHAVHLPLHSLSLSLTRSLVLPSLFACQTPSYCPLSFSHTYSPLRTPFPTSDKACGGRSHRARPAVSKE